MQIALIWLHLLKCKMQLVTRDVMTMHQESAAWLAATVLPHEYFGARKLHVNILIMLNISKTF